MLTSLAVLALLAGSLQPEAPATKDALEDRLMADLRAVPPKRAALGDAEHREGLVKTEAWLLDQLKAAGLTATPQEFVWASPALKAAVLGKDAPEPPADDARFKFRNYIVEFPGSDSAREVLILGAHYDAVPNAPGADDNGSGLVGLLEIARQLKGTPHRRTIRLVFFTLEEVGLIGSMHYVKEKRADWTPARHEDPNPGPDEPPRQPGQPAPPKEKLIGMVSLECIGYFSEKEGSQVSPIPKFGDKPILDLKIPTKGTFIGMAGIARHREFSQRLLKEMQAAEPTLEVLAADMLPIAPPDFLRSDHAPFLLNSQPAVILTDTANFRNPNYHKPTDTPDTLDPKRWAAVVRAVAKAASAIADPGPARPQERK